MYETMLHIFYIYNSHLIKWLLYVKLYSFVYIDALNPS